MEFNRGAVVAWTAGVCGGAGALAAVLLAFSGQGWRIAAYVLAGIAAFALTLLIGTGLGPALVWSKEVVRRRRQRREPSHVIITDRWRYTPVGFDVGTLANLGQKSFSHHCYLRSAENKPPAVRFGAFIACSVLTEDEPTAEHLRSSMRDFLSQPEVMDLIGELTDVDADAGWHSQPGRGRFNLEADLLASPDSGTVLASVFLLLPERGIMSYGKDRAGAELYMHVDLPLKNGVPVKVGLAEWYARFAAAMDLPRLLARFLASASITARADPAARFAVQVQARTTAPTGLDEIVDFGELPVLSPRRYSMQFDGWAVADLQGKPADAISRRFLTELCESTGRTGYENLLSGLRGGRRQVDDVPPDRQEKPTGPTATASAAVEEDQLRAEFMEGLYQEFPDEPLTWIDPRPVGLRIGIDFGPELRVMIDFLERAGYLEANHEESVRLTAAGRREVTKTHGR